MRSARRSALRDCGNLRQAAKLRVSRIVKSSKNVSVCRQYL